MTKLDWAAPAFAGALAVTWVILDFGAMEWVQPWALALATVAAVSLYAVIAWLGYATRVRAWPMVLSLAGILVGSALGSAALGLWQGGSLDSELVVGDAFSSAVPLLIACAIGALAYVVVHRRPKERPYGLLALPTAVQLLGLAVLVMAKMSVGNDSPPPGDSLFLGFYAGLFLLIGWPSLMLGLLIMRPISRGAWWAIAAGAVGSGLFALAGLQNLRGLFSSEPMPLGDYVFAALMLLGGLAALAACGWLAMTTVPSERVKYTTDGRPSVL